MNLLAPKISLIYSAILTLFYVGLSFNVIRWRWVELKGLGHTTDPSSGLFRAVRIHGNFMEYVPLALLLLTLDDMTGASVLFIHGPGITLIVARSLHVLGILKSSNFSPYRALGMILTFTVLIVLAIRLLVKGLA